MRCLSLASLAFVSCLSSVVACEPFLAEAPAAPAEDLACGAAPGAFDPAGDVVYAVGPEGCARIERRALDDGSFAPVRLVAHVDGFTHRIDIDTDALTYEGAADGTAIVTGDDVMASIEFDVCTGEWTVDVNEGEAILAVAG